jgi:GMP synthase (glutamine-hydrolysing)
MDDARGLVVMGGSMGVYEADRYPFLRDELRLIEDALQRDLPILGICLGSQLLAAALGAPVFPSGIKEIGWYPIEFDAEARRDPLFAGMPEHLEAFHWHGDTFQLPAGATRLASSKKTREQAFRYGQRAWGLQFHLEVTAPVVDAMTSGGGSELAAAGVSLAAVTRGVARHGSALEAVARTVFGRFAQLVRE